MITQDMQSYRTNQLVRAAVARELTRHLEIPAKVTIAYNKLADAKQEYREAIGELAHAALFSNGMRPTS